MKQRIFLTLLAIGMILFFAGCAGNSAEQSVAAIDDATESVADEITETAEPEESESEELPTEYETVVDGELVYKTEGCYGIDGGNTESGWITYSDAEGKGYGTPCYAMNLATGQIIEGEEGAEVYLCADGVLQFEWRDATTGEKASSSEVLRYNEADGEAKNYQLYAMHYDVEGNMTDEELVTDFTQTTEDTYLLLMNAMAPVKTKYGVPELSSDNSYYFWKFADDNGDAVAYDRDGKEIIRYRNRSAQDLYVSVHTTDKYISVTDFSLPGSMEVYKLN